MLRRTIKKEGQTLLEYILVIICIVGALVAMQHYVKRAVQGRLRMAADQIGEQYEPKKLSGSRTTSIDRDITVKITQESFPLNGTEGTALLREEIIDKDEVTREGTETMGAFGSGLWE